VLVWPLPQGVIDRFCRICASAGWICLPD
jgi:hypothetical protein